MIEADGYLIQGTDIVCLKIRIDVCTIAQVRKVYEQNDALGELVAQIRKSKAVDWLLRNSTLVDPDGNPISADTLFGDEDGSNGDDAE